MSDQMLPRSRYSPEGTVAVIILVAMIGVLLLQVVGRTGLLTPPIWTEELSRWLFVWMAFVAFAEAERTDSQLKADFLVQMMPRRVRLAIFSFFDVVFLVVFTHLVWIGIKGVERTMNSAAVTMPVPDAVLYASFPVAGVFILLRVAQRLLRRLRELRAGETAA